MGGGRPGRHSTAAAPNKRATVNFAKASLRPVTRTQRPPATALFAGVDGLDAYRTIAPVLRPQLTPGGVACIEIGADQADAAAALFADEGLTVAVRRDLAGRDRCLVVTP